MTQTSLRQLGMRLRKWRTQRGLSQDALAKKAKITREYVNKLETGRYNPTVTVLQGLAKALRIRVSQLLE